MKRIFTLFLFISLGILATSCRNRKVLLPGVSGKAGEVIVVMDKASWEGTTGEMARELLAADCEYLPFNREPLYTLVNVTPGSFADLFKVHRNIVLFNIGNHTDSTAVVFRKDVWAKPQCVIEIDAGSNREADSLLSAKGKIMVSALDQAERDRVISNSIRFEQTGLAKEVKKRFGGSPHFPIGYSFKKATDNFVWIASEKEKSIQGIFVYSYPVDSDAPFLTKEIISHRNEVLKENVPGMFENTYMTTSTAFEPSVEFIRFHNREFAQARGLWEVEGDYMGGPFVSHSFYSLDGSDIIVAEAFVYAPKLDKRQILRQVESIIYSWEWCE